MSVPRGVPERGAGSRAASNSSWRHAEPDTRPSRGIARTAEEKATSHNQEQARRANERARRAPEGQSARWAQSSRHTSGAAARAAMADGDEMSDRAADFSDVTEFLATARPDQAFSKRAWLKQRVSRASTWSLYCQLYNDVVRALGDANLAADLYYGGDLLKLNRPVSPTVISWLETIAATSDRDAYASEIINEYYDHGARVVSAVCLTSRSEAGRHVPRALHPRAEFAVWLIEWLDRCHVVVSGAPEPPPRFGSRAMPGPAAWGCAAGAAARAAWQAALAQVLSTVRLSDSYKTGLPVAVASMLGVDTSDMVAAVTSRETTLFSHIDTHLKFLDRTPVSSVPTAPVRAAEPQRDADEWAAVSDTSTRLPNTPAVSRDGVVAPTVPNQLAPAVAPRGPWPRVGETSIQDWISVAPSADGVPPTAPAQRRATGESPSYQSWVSSEYDQRALIDPADYDEMAMVDHRYRTWVASWDEDGELTEPDTPPAPLPPPQPLTASPVGYHTAPPPRSRRARLDRDRSLDRPRRAPRARPEPAAPPVAGGPAFPGPADADFGEARAIPSPPPALADVSIDVGGEAGDGQLDPDAGGLCPPLALVVAACTRWLRGAHPAMLGLAAARPNAPRAPPPLPPPPAPAVMGARAAARAAVLFGARAPEAVGARDVFPVPFAVDAETVQAAHPHLTVLQASHVIDSAAPHYQAESLVAGATALTVADMVRAGGYVQAGAPLMHARVFNEAFGLPRVPDDRLVSSMPTNDESALECRCCADAYDPDCRLCDDTTVVVVWNANAPDAIARELDARPNALAVVVVDTAPHTAFGKAYPLRTPQGGHEVNWYVRNATPAELRAHGAALTRVISALGAVRVGPWPPARDHEFADGYGATWVRAHVAPVGVAHTVTLWQRAANPDRAEPDVPPLPRYATGAHPPPPQYEVFDASIGRMIAGDYTVVRCGASYALPENAELPPILLTPEHVLTLTRVNMGAQQFLRRTLNAVVATTARQIADQGGVAPGTSPTLTTESVMRALVFIQVRTNESYSRADASGHLYALAEAAAKPLTRPTWRTHFVRWFRRVFSPRAWHQFAGRCVRWCAALLGMRPAAARLALEHALAGGQGARPWRPRPLAVSPAADVLTRRLFAAAPTAMARTTAAAGRALDVAVRMFEVVIGTDAWFMSRAVPRATRHINAANGLYGAINCRAALPTCTTDALVEGFVGFGLIMRVQALSMWLLGRKTTCTVVAPISEELITVASPESRLYIAAFEALTYRSVQPLVCHAALFAINHVCGWVPAAIVHALWNHACMIARDDSARAGPRPASLSEAAAEGVRLLHPGLDTAVNAPAVEEVAGLIVTPATATYKPSNYGCIDLNTVVPADALLELSRRPGCAIAIGPVCASVALLPDRATESVYARATNAPAIIDHSVAFDEWVEESIQQECDSAQLDLPDRHEYIDRRSNGRGYGLAAGKRCAYHAHCSEYECGGWVIDNGMTLTVAGKEEFLNKVTAAPCRSLRYTHPKATAALGRNSACILRALKKWALTHSPVWVACGSSDDVIAIRHEEFAAQYAVVLGCDGEKADSSFSPADFTMMSEVAARLQCDDDYLLLIAYMTGAPLGSTAAARLRQAGYRMTDWRNPRRAVITLGPSRTRVTFSRSLPSGAPYTTCDQTRRHTYAIAFAIAHTGIDARAIVYSDDVLLYTNTTADAARIAAVALEHTGVRLAFEPTGHFGNQRSPTFLGSYLAPCSPRTVATNDGDRVVTTVLVKHPARVLSRFAWVPPRDANRKMVRAYYEGVFQRMRVLRSCPTVPWIMAAALTRYFGRAYEPPAPDPVTSAWYESEFGIACYGRELYQLLTGHGQRYPAVASYSYPEAALAYADTAAAELPPQPTWIEGDPDESIFRAPALKGQLLPAEFGFELPLGALARAPVPDHNQHPLLHRFLPAILAPRLSPKTFATTHQPFRLPPPVPYKTYQSVHHGFDDTDDDLQTAVTDTPELFFAQHFNACALILSVMPRKQHHRERRERDERPHRGHAGHAAHREGGRRAVEYVDAPHVVPQPPGVVSGAALRARAVLNSRAPIARPLAVARVRAAAMRPGPAARAPPPPGAAARALAARPQFQLTSSRHEGRARIHRYADNATTAARVFGAANALSYQAGATKTPRKGILSAGLDGLLNLGDRIAAIPERIGDSITTRIDASTASLQEQFVRADEMSMKSAVAAAACQQCPGEGVMAKVPLQFQYPTGTTKSRMLVNVSSGVTALAGPNVGLYDTAVLVYPGINAKINMSGTVTVAGVWSTFTNIVDPLAAQLSTLGVAYLPVALGVRVQITTPVLNRGGVMTASQYPGLVQLVSAGIANTLNIGIPTVTAIDMDDEQGIIEFLLTWDAANVADMDPVPIANDNLDGPLVFRFVSPTPFSAVLTIDSTYEIVPSVLGANVLPVTEYSGDPGDLAKVRAIIENEVPIAESMGAAGSRARSDAAMRLLDEVDALPGPPAPSVTGSWGDEVDVAAHVMWCASGQDPTNIPAGSVPPRVRQWWASRHGPDSLVPSDSYLTARAPGHAAIAQRAARTAASNAARDAARALTALNQPPTAGTVAASLGSANVTPRPQIPAGWDLVPSPNAVPR